MIPRISAMIALSVVSISSTGGELPKHVIHGERFAPFNGEKPGLQIGRGIYFSDSFGIVFHMARSNGTRRKEGNFENCEDMGDHWACRTPPPSPFIGVPLPELKNTEIWVATRPLTSWMVETAFRWSYKGLLYANFGAGLHYSVMDVETDIEYKYELTPFGEITRGVRARNEFTNRYSEVGPLLSFGVCAKLFDGLGLTLTIRKRFGDLEEKKDYYSDAVLIETDIDLNIGIGIAIMF